MRRREFIAGLGGVVAWPCGLQAQLAGGRMRRIGVLMGGSERDVESSPRVAAFEQSLEKSGWTVGRNLRVDYYWSMADVERTRAAAAELGRSAVDVIVADGSTRLAAAREATRAIPIVFVFVSEPDGQGFVASFARPGGYITGFTGAGGPALGGKLLGFLKEIAPQVRRVSIIYNPETSPGNIPEYFLSVEAAARTLAVETQVTPVHGPPEIEAIITSLGRESGNGLIVAPDNYTTVHRRLVLDLASRHRLPAIYAYRYFVADGGLASYGVDAVDPFRQAAGYVDRILRGEKPADLPVQQPTKFEFVINLKTAKALGLTIPETLLATADEVIQ